jgi:hypothetical protein
LLRQALFVEAERSSTMLNHVIPKHLTKKNNKNHDLLGTEIAHQK